MTFTFSVLLCAWRPETPQAAGRGCVLWLGEACLTSVAAFYTDLSRVTLPPACQHGCPSWVPAGVPPMLGPHLLLQEKASWHTAAATGPHLLLLLPHFATVTAWPLAGHPSSDCFGAPIPHREWCWNYLEVLENLAEWGSLDSQHYHKGVHRARSTRPCPLHPDAFNDQPPRATQVAKHWPSLLVPGLSHTQGAGAPGGTKGWKMLGRAPTRATAPLDLACSGPAAPTETATK